MGISAAQRTEYENRARAAMDRLPRGETPSGGKSNRKGFADEGCGWIDVTVGPPPRGLRGHDSERRDKPMIPMITALVSSRGADRV
ncbi:hypothetical protein F8144_04055 [Streptomyces triticiradicis]|uniref:Uncharacterized protein n=1 Tax=Streptomyces triticiradicis TaxID=2651189 RepID=A0A7J5DN88_9ACTN|nr:hypothetical protein F8144_04055 [Streptomyces triticiradicis]